MEQLFLTLTKYSSIENTYRTEFMEKIKEHEEQLLVTPTWVVTEKINGSNFSFTTDGSKVIPGSRNNFLLTEDEQKKFCNSDKIIKRLSPHFIELFKLCQKFIKDTHMLVVYGELFCTDYPELKRVDKLINKGVYYSPTVEWLAFDLMINGKYINYNDAIVFFEECKLPYVKISYSGTLDTCISWSEQHHMDNSTIPPYYNLPELKDNIREGNVLKPVWAYYLGHDRVILKHKNDHFSEKQKAPKDQIKKNVSLSSDLQLAFEKSLEYVTENRLNNVLSKEDTESRRNKNKINGLFANDALNDFEKENNTLFRALTTKDKKILKSLVQNECWKYTHMT